MRLIFTDERIAQAARELYANGEVPTVRNVRALMGGGTQDRISRIIKALNLPTPVRVKNQLPDYLIKALERFMGETRRWDGLSLTRSFRDSPGRTKS